jgi:hypothetical protein
LIDMCDNQNLWAPDSKSGVLYQNDGSSVHYVCSMGDATICRGTEIEYVNELITDRCGGRYEDPKTAAGESCTEEWQKCYGRVPLRDDICGYDISDLDGRR